MAKRVPDAPSDKPPKRRAPRQLPTAELPADDLQAIFGQNLKIARLKRAMTLMELAEAAGMNPAYVSQVENGARNLTLASMKKLAGVVDQDVWDMIRPSEGREKPPSLSSKK